MMAKKADVPIRTVRKPWWRQPHRTHITGESMTAQSHAESCDINRIVAQFHRTGSLPSSHREPQYLDVTGLQGDLTEAYNRSSETIETFEDFRKNYKPKDPEKSKSDDTPPSPSPSPTPDPNPEKS